MDYQVVLSPSARADLRDIIRYTSLDAPDLGRIVPEFEDPFIREIVVRSYRVVYPLTILVIGRGHSLLARRPWHTRTQFANRLTEPMSKHAELLALAKLRQSTKWERFTGIGDYYGGKYECDFVSPYTKSAANVEAMVMLQDCSSDESMKEPFDEQAEPWRISFL